MNVEGEAMHTPGPWEAGRSDMSTIVDGFDSKWVYAGDKYVAVASGANVSEWDEVMANARLIAAAPEMLDALRALMAEPHGCTHCDSGKLRKPVHKYDEPGHQPDCPYQKALDAIAKAEALSEV